MHLQGLAPLLVWARRAQWHWEWGLALLHWRGLALQLVRARRVQWH